MAGTLGGKDLVRANLDTNLPQPFVQLCAQTGQAKRRAIVDQVLYRTAADLTHSQGNGVGGTPAGRHPATAEVEQLGMALTELLPAPLDSLIAQWLVEQRLNQPVFSDKKTGAMPCLQAACGHQPVIGLDHTGLTKPLLPRQLTDRRQATPGTQALVLYPGLQLGRQLLHQWRG
ncbi:hypothetical protein D3C77_303000 [compost metagenome]